MLSGKELAGSSKTSLDFIRHQQDIVLLADLGNFLEISRWRDDHPTLTLNGFQQDRCGIWSDCFLNSVRITVRNVYKSWRERAKVLAIGRFRGKADDRNRPPVKVTCRRDDLCLVARHTFDLVRPLARQLERSFDSFRPAVHRQGHFVASHLGKLFIEQRQLIIAKSARRQRDFPGLLQQSIQDLRVNVSLVDRRISRETIEIFLSIDIVDPDAFGALDDHIERMIIMRPVLFFDSNKIFCIHNFTCYPTPNRRARMAFWAWRRLCACGKITECGPSATSSVSSWLRCAGKQCITITSLSASLTS